MIIYLAATAPGNETLREREMLDIKNRLLSYFLIQHKMMECDKVFKVIENENLHSSPGTK